VPTVGGLKLSSTIIIINYTLITTGTTLFILTGSGIVKNMYLDFKKNQTLPPPPHGQATNY
jgi:hypothetical protein